MIFIILFFIIFIIALVLFVSFFTFYYWDIIYEEIHFSNNDNYTYNDYDDDYYKKIHEIMYS